MSYPCMKQLFTILVLWLITSFAALAQDDLFGTVKKEPKKGLIISANGNFDIPMADMASRFGLSYRFGPALEYKTSSNWIFGAKTDFIIGGKIKEDSFLINLSPEGKGIIGLNEQRNTIFLYERGYMLGLQVGKIISLSKYNSDQGLYLQLAGGFIQHKILITDKSEQVQQLKGAYKKGYDRLTNGLFIEPYVGYIYFSKNNLLNFHIGLDAMLGFTQGRRTFLYDVRRAGDEKRFDVLFGIRGGWMIPAFKKKSEEYFFE